LIEVLVNGSLRVIASSLEADIVKSMKMQRYIKFDFVGFFFD